MTIKCEMVQYLATSGPYGGVGSGIAVANMRCNTHSMEMGQVPIYAGMLCPIGRIEQAVEEGFARIEARLDEALK